MPINWEAPIEIRDGRNSKWFWVNKEVWQDSRLTAADKVVYGTLAFFSNQLQEAFPALKTIALFSDLSERQIYVSIKKLQELKYIYKKSGGGRNRRNYYQMLKINPANIASFIKTTQYSAINPAKSTVKTLQNISENNNYINNNKLTITLDNKLSKGDSPQFGNSEINLCLEELTKLLGYKPIKETLNRYAIKRLITKLGSVKRVLAAIQYAFKIRAEDKYAPRIYNYLDLEEKLEHLQNYGRGEVKRSVNVEEGIAYLERKKSSVNVD